VIVVGAYGLSVTLIGKRSQELLRKKLKPKHAGVIKMPRKKYSKTETAVVDKNCVTLREEFPSKLIDLFVKMHNSDYSKEEHKKYKKEATVFLKGKAEDILEQCRLIVRLAKATFDLVKEEKTNVKKEKKEKAKDEKNA